MHRCDFDQTSELQSPSKTVSTENKAKNVQNPLYITLHQECVGARHVIYMVIHVVRLSVPWLSFPHLVPFRVFLLPFFFYLNVELNLFLHVVVIGAKNHWHSANWGVWPLGRKHTSHICRGSTWPWLWTSSEDWTCSVREPVGECYFLAMIAHGENKPRWHNERRQAKVNIRPRSSSISATRTFAQMSEAAPRSAWQPVRQWDRVRGIRQVSLWVCWCRPALCSCLVFRHVFRTTCSSARSTIIDVTHL